MPNRSDGATVTKLPVAASSDAFEFPPQTKSVEYLGRTFVFRELTVGENDLCRELSTGPDDTFDGRVMIRQMIVLGAMDPPMTLEDLDKVPQRLYAQFINLVNDLNDPATFEADPGN